MSKCIGGVVNDSLGDLLAYSPGKSFGQLFEEKKQAFDSLQAGLATSVMPSFPPMLSLRDHLAADIRDLKRILLDAGYDPQVINRQLSELIRQNKELGGLDKPSPHLPKVDSH